MSRAYTPGGRFSSDFERNSISDGITSELTNPVGTHADWWLFDITDSTIDPIYDVGDNYSAGAGGKVWTGPYIVPVISAKLKQGDTKISQQGFYNADLLHLTVNSTAIQLVFAFSCNSFSCSLDE